MVGVMKNRISVFLTRLARLLNNQPSTGMSPRMGTLVMVSMESWLRRPPTAKTCPLCTCTVCPWCAC